MKKRADGRFQKSFYYEGKRYYVYSNKKADLEEKAFAKLQVLKGLKINHDNPFVDDYYKNFKKIRENKVKENTIQTEQRWFDRASECIIDGIRFGSMRIRDVKPADVKILQLLLIDNPKLSTTSINSIIGHVNHVFNEALKDETIEKNPFVCITSLKRTEQKAQNTKHRALTEDESQQLIKIAADTNSFYINGMKLMLNTGIRVGELGALTFADCDIDSGFININKTVSRDKSGHIKIGNTPKTSTSNRRIVINDSIKLIITNQKKLIREHFGFNFNKQMFPALDGSILHSAVLNPEIRRITDEMGIDYITSHAFRATFATRFIEQRPNDYKILSEILGHSDINITLNLYTHVMLQNKQKAMKELKIVL